MPLTEEELDAIADAGFMGPTGKSPKKYAVPLRDEILENHNIGGSPPYKEAAAKLGVLPETLCVKHIKQVTPGLVAWTAQVLATGPNGAVQKIMPNGFVLGSSLITKPSVITLPDGSEITRNIAVSVRWASKNAKAIRALILDPMLEKQDARGQRDKVYLAMIQQRQKTLDAFIRDELLPGMQEKYAHGLGLVPELEEGEDEAEAS